MTKRNPKGDHAFHIREMRDKKPVDSQNPLFGVVKWMKSIGLTNQADQQWFINEFLKQTRFNPKHRGITDENLSWHQSKWISDRFGAFSKFVYDNSAE